MQDVRVTREPTRHGFRLVVRVHPHPEFAVPAYHLGGTRARISARYEHWHFDSRDESRVRALLMQIWGTDGSLETDADRVTVRWDITGWRLNQQELWLAGRFVARRDQRDSVVRLGWGVVVVQGGFPASGGSVRNPRLSPLDDTLVEIRDLPRAAAAEALADGTATLVEAEPLAAEDLRVRRKQLLSELAAINATLNELSPAPTEPRRCRCGRHECPPEGYTVAEVAELTGCTPTTVSTWCRKGMIPAFRSGGGWIMPAPLPHRVGRTTIPRAPVPDTDR
jgi:excisionase family DNA binding protein